jgi:hypothetical protein
MNITDQFRRNVRGFYIWIGATLLLGIGPAVAHRLIERETTAARIAAVVIGVGSMLPWLWVIVSVIRHGDEFARRMHLVAIAIAGGASLVLMVAMDWLQQAWFIKSADLTLMWTGCLLLWFVTLMATKRYYERER